MFRIILCSRNHWIQIPAQMKPRTSQKNNQIVMKPINTHLAQHLWFHFRPNGILVEPTSPPSLFHLTQLLFHPVCGSRAGTVASPSVRQPWLQAGKWCQPSKVQRCPSEPRAVLLSRLGLHAVQITVLSTRAITSADPCVGIGKSLAGRGAVLGTAVINTVNAERSWSHLGLIWRALLWLHAGPAATGPNGAVGYRGK